MIRDAIKVALTEAVIPNAKMHKKYKVVDTGDGYDSIEIGYFTDDPEDKIILKTDYDVSSKAEIEINYKGVYTEYGEIVDDVIKACKTLFGFKINSKDKVYQTFMQGNYGFVPESLSTNESKESKPKILSDMEAWLKASNYTFKVTDSKKHVIMRGKKPVGATYLTFDTGSIAQEVMDLLSKTSKFAGLRPSWGLNELGFVWLMNKDA